MNLYRYIIRRLLFTIPTVFGALLLMFILSRVLPGDPVLMILGPAHSSPENIETMRELMGLDKIPANAVRPLCRSDPAGKPGVFLAGGGACG